MTVKELITILQQECKDDDHVYTYDDGEVVEINVVENKEFNDITTVILI